MLWSVVVSKIQTSKSDISKLLKHPISTNTVSFFQIFYLFLGHPFILLNLDPRYPPPFHPFCRILLLFAAVINEVATWRSNHSAVELMVRIIRSLPHIDPKIFSLLKHLSPKVNGMLLSDLL